MISFTFLLTNKHQSMDKTSNNFLSELFVVKKKINIKSTLLRYDILRALETESIFSLKILKWEREIFRNLNICNILEQGC